jgi:O-antigen/teichoic acid export membrane protein
LPSEIIIYSLFSKIFIQSVFLLQSINNSIWPKLSEHFFSGNSNKILAQVAKLNYLTIFSVGFLGILLFFCLEWLSSLFLYNQVSYSTTINLTITLIAIQYIFRGISDNFSLVLQSTNRVHRLVYITIGQAVISCLLQVLLVKPFGIHGIIIGISISYLAGLMFLIPQTLQRLAVTNNRE